MKKITVSFCLVLLFVIALSQPRHFLFTRGKEIIGTDGKPFYMKGTNLGNWLVPEGYMFKFRQATSPRLIQETLYELVGPGKANIFWKKYLDSYITRDDIHYMRSIGMNSIRIPFHYKLFTDEDYLGGRGAARGFALMDRVIGWCRQEGLYVILDMHCAPGGQTGDNIDDSWGTPFLFENPVNTQLTINTWKLIAAHYRNETTIMGYDLLNEPIATYFDSSRYNHYLEPLYKVITAAIRTVDANHLVFLGGAQWDGNFRIFGKPFDSKVVYTFHKYWMPPKLEEIKAYTDFRDRYHVPVYCGETGENTDEWIRQFRELLEQQHIGWHFWPYKKMDNTRGILTFAIPMHYEEIRQFADTTRSSFELIRKLIPTDETTIHQALDGFLENCLFKNCRQNAGYIKGLGLEVKK